VLENIACHVWAMGGEFDDSSARKMNTKYDAGAMLLMNGGQCADKFLNGLLKEAIEMGRTAPGSIKSGAYKTAALRFLVHYCRNQTAPIKPDGKTYVYGLFRHSGREIQYAPEHMWIKHGSYVYDTMPGSPVRKAASNKHGTNPAHEAQELDVHEVAYYPVGGLTKTQQAALPHVEL
jgi:hypothetical protein